MKNILKEDNKKGQLKIGDAPGVVVVMLVLFMILGTSAFVLESYQAGFSVNKYLAVINESVTPSERNNHSTLNGALSCNSENFEAIQVLNGSSGEAYTTVSSADYILVSSTGAFYNLTEDHGNATWLTSYAYDYTGVACNVTEDLTGEFEDNTSIAGMVLTISLIGIVLSILIGIFYIFTGKRGL